MVAWLDTSFFERKQPTHLNLISFFLLITFRTSYLRSGTLAAKSMVPLCLSSWRQRTTTWSCSTSPCLQIWKPSRWILLIWRNGGWASKSHLKQCQPRSLRKALPSTRLLRPMNCNAVRWPWHCWQQTSSVQSHHWPLCCGQTVSTCQQLSRRSMAWSSSQLVLLRSSTLEKAKLARWRWKPLVARGMCSRSKACNPWSKAHFGGLRKLLREKAIWNIPSLRWKVWRFHAWPILDQLKVLHSFSPFLVSVLLTRPKATIPNQRRKSRKLSEVWLFEVARMDSIAALARYVRYAVKKKECFSSSCSKYCKPLAFKPYRWLLIASHFRLSSSWASDCKPYWL